MKQVDGALFQFRDKYRKQRRKTQFACIDNTDQCIERWRLLGRDEERSWPTRTCCSMDKYHRLGFRIDDKKSSVLDLAGRQEFVAREFAKV